MKVKINEDECTGCEECVEAVEDVFGMTDDGELAMVKVEVVPADLAGLGRSGCRKPRATPTHRQKSIMS